MGTVFAEGQDRRETGATATRTTCALLIVLPHRRNVTKANANQRADINADLHRGRTAQDIHRSLSFVKKILEQQLVLLCHRPHVIALVLVRQLRRVLFRIDDANLNRARERTTYRRKPEVVSRHIARFRVAHTTSAPRTKAVQIAGRKSSACLTYLPLLANPGNGPDGVGPEERHLALRHHEYLVKDVSPV